MTDIYEVDPTPVPQPQRATRRRKKRAKKTVAPKQVAPTQRAVPRIPPEPLQPLAIAAPAMPPAPPSPAVLKLQEQVVELVAQRSAARQKLADAHAAYLLAQSAFQAAEAGVKGTEQDAQYLLGLIAQLENRPPVVNVAQTPVLQMPSLAGVSSEPAATVAAAAAQQGGRNYATASADDLKREMRGMM